MILDKTKTGGRRTRAGAKHPCPRCGSRDVARIQYGMPAWDAAWEKNVQAGEWAAGGCVLFPRQPDYVCSSCHAEFQSGGSVTGDGDLDPEAAAPHLEG